MGSMEPKINYQSENIESSILHPLHVKHCFFNTTKFINLTTAPTCNSQNHAAMTILYVPLSLHVNFLLLLIFRPPSPPSGPSLSWPSVPSPANFSSMFPVTMAHCPVLWSSIDSFGGLFLTLLEGSRGRACGAVFIESTVMSQAFTFTHHSLTHLKQLPVLLSPFIVSALYRYTIFYLLHCIFLALFLCLDAQILTIGLQLPTVFSTVTCCRGL